MLAPFLIMFREGVEAALIVGIIASYLRQTGQIHRMRAIWIGIVLATLMCLTVAVILQVTRQEFPQKQQELFASVIAFVAVGVLTWMVFWMKQAARSIKGELQAQVEAALRSKERLGLALVGMAFFAVAREGLETVVFLMATLQQSVGIETPVGAFLGYIAAISVGVGIYQGGIRLNLGRFFKWTGVFIILVAAGLLAGAIKSLHEAGVWNGLQDIVFDLSSTLPKHELLGTLLAGFFGYNDAPTWSEIIVYICYLVPMLWLFLVSSKPKSTSRQAI